jgi:hypothetical protein
VSKHIPITLVAALAMMALSTPLVAQARSTVTPSGLDAAVTVQAPGSRAALTAALATDRSLAAAGRLGLTADDIATRVATLDDATVQQLTDRLLVGGANVVISTTAIIIVLLILILLTT